MDRWSKASLAAGTLLAGAGVFYHLVIYLPGVERARQAEARSAATADLEQCRHGARMFHDVAWAAACMSLAIQDEPRYAACVKDPQVLDDPKRGRGWCDHSFHTDGSAECSLPDARAARINASLEDAEQKCVLEARRREAP